MLLTLEPSLLETLRECWNNLSPGTMRAFGMRCTICRTEDDCRDPPSDEALLATATELAHMMNTHTSLRKLTLRYVTTSMASPFLSTCSWLEQVTLASFSLAAADVREMFSIKTLRQLTLEKLNLSTMELTNAFCFGMESSSLKVLTMDYVSFSPEHEAEVAMTLARSKTLVEFDYQGDVTPSFCDTYCAALSNNYESKLESVRLRQGLITRRQVLCQGFDLIDKDNNIIGIKPPAVRSKIKKMLKLKLQRKGCPPLFAAIGNAKTDARRKQPEQLDCSDSATGSEPQAPMGGLKAL